MTRSFVSAATVNDALSALSGGARPVAGGTDLVVGARQGKAPLPDAIVAIDRIPGFRAIDVSDGGLRLGTLVTHGDIMASEEIRTRYTALADASAIVGSHATRAQGTIGGNVMNASPAMDTGGPLLCFGATAILRSASGERSLELDELWTGPGSTSARSDELLVALDVPAPSAGTGSSYVRLEYRRQMEIAVVGATAVVTVDGDRIVDARVAITALTPTIRRVPAAESALAGTDGGEGAV
ncbi:MAG TPA: FAD binding domain-containing protein, partial [Actinomycetota bacterium]